MRDKPIYKHPPCPSCLFLGGVTIEEHDRTDFGGGTAVHYDLDYDLYFCSEAGSPGLKAVSARFHDDPSACYHYPYPLSPHRSYPPAIDRAALLARERGL